MKDQKIHLENAIAQQKELVDEIENLNKQINIKRDSAIKLQGVIEYLSSLENDKEKEISEISAQKFS